MIDSNVVKKNYKKRLIDDKVKDYLKLFGAVSIEGPKWCGKTWSSIYASNSVINLANKDTRDRVLLNYNEALDGDYPRLIDEWNLIPELWDMVRNKCDETKNKGNYILTCSTKLTDESKKEKIKHSGAGRIGKIYMRPMSLYESGESNGTVSITKMLNGTQRPAAAPKYDLKDLANFIIRGGWPENIDTKENLVHVIPRSYIDAILDSDMNDDKERDKVKMQSLLKSLARNESTIASTSTILDDIGNQKNNNIISSRTTLDDYLSALERLHIIDNQPAYTENYRSKERLGKSAKRHFTDPSLACAMLNLTSNKLLEDIRTFGFMYESLVERDLDIYMRALDGHLYHFRDNVTGLEVDSILEFYDGEYAAIEIKTGFNEIDEAKNNLKRFYNNMDKKPKFMAIIVGNIDTCGIDEETGIYIFPITALKP